MLTVVHRVGRLVEVRLGGNPSLTVMGDFEAECRTCLGDCFRQAHKPVIVCTDLRAAQVWAPDVAERWVALLRGENATVERNGMIGTPSPLLGLQVSRIIKAASSDDRRRVFTKVPPLVAWLDEVLAPAESKRLREFLAEGEPDVPADH